MVSLEELQARIRRYRRNDAAVDPGIGCNILAEPLFFDRSAWVPVPASWARNIAQGESYDTGTAEGRSLWSAVQEAASRPNVAAQMGVAGGVGSDERYGAEYLTRGRLGQGAFRVMVTDAYQRRCAVTGEKRLPVLEAAHIRPYAFSGFHRVENGILLRSDLHKLFDLGHITVTPELKLLVSRRLREEWHNGREYYAHHGQPLRFHPVDLVSRPAAEFLEWHNENRFHE